MCTSRTENKSYIGRTSKTLKYRFGQHVAKAEKGSSLKFHEAIRRCGKDDFTLRILENDVPGTLIGSRERYWISFYNTFSGGYNMSKSGGSNGLLTPESKAKYRETIYKIGPDGLTSKAKQVKKRKKTLLAKDPDVFKKIGEKSSKTQKRNKKNAKSSSPSFNGKKVLIISKDGIIQWQGYHYQLLELDEDMYPKWVFEWSLKNKKPMYTSSPPRKRKEIYLEYLGSIACYEGEVYSSIDVSFKEHRDKILRIFFYVRDKQGSVLYKVKNKEIKDFCVSHNLSGYIFRKAYQSGNPIKKGSLQGCTISRIEEDIK